jgi:hypothetical protein
MVATIVVGTNSFVTEAESNTILEEFVQAGPWATALNKVTALITAFYDITTFELFDPDTGLAVDPNNAPLPVKQAQSLWALDLSQDPSKANSQGVGGTNISSVGAGSAKVSFFRPEDKGRFSPAVSRLLTPYLVGNTAGTILGSCASGADGVSSFKEAGSGLTEGYK